MTMTLEHKPDPDIEPDPDPGPDPDSGPDPDFEPDPDSGPDPDLITDSVDDDGELVSWDFPESTPETRADAARAARHAAELIREHGWIKGKYGNPLHGMCCMGALQEALGPMTETDRGWNTLYFEIRTTLWNKFRISSIPSWNDALPEETGKATVISTLESAADYLEQK